MKFKCIVVDLFPQLVFQRGNLDEVTLRLLRYDAPNALRSEIPRSELPTPESTVEMLRHPKYYGTDAESTSAPVDLSALPQQLQDAIERSGQANDADNLSVLPSSLALRAFGATANYLKRCLIDQSLLSLKQVFGYTPADVQLPNAGAGAGAGESRNSLLPWSLIRSGVVPCCNAMCCLAVCL